MKKVKGKKWQLDDEEETTQVKDDEVDVRATEEAEAAGGSVKMENGCRQRKKKER